jgi:hypothetical protein
VKEIKSNLLPIDVGKLVVWGGRPNSVCGLSFHLSHHGAESMWLKKWSDVVKETWAKKVKENKSNLQNKHATPHWCWKGGGMGQEAKLSLWAKFLPFPVGNVAIEMKYNMWHSYEKFVKHVIDLKTHHKIPAAAY